MKIRFSSLAKSSLCYLVALAGFFCGTVLLVLFKNSALPSSPPILSAFLTDTPLLSLVADYAEEVKLLLPAAILPFLVKNPLPAYPFLFIRGVYCGLSTAFLFLKGTLFFALLYFLLHAAALFAHASALHCLLPALALPKNNRLPLFYPFLFFAGSLCIFVILRNVAYRFF